MNGRGVKGIKVNVFIKFLVLVCSTLIVLGAGADNCLAAAYNIADDATGGSCSSIGVWDQNSKTCVLNSDVVGGISIIGNNITLDGNGHSLTGTEAYGVYIESFSGATIRNLRIDGFSYGIFLAFSGNNHILSNTITNAAEEGIGIWGSFGSEVAGNDIGYSGWDGIGVVLSSASITIHDNTIHNNGWGLWFAGSGNGNLVYNNIFIDNIYQADGWDADPVTFNLDEWQGGNFWNDLTGPDANGDGIVDVPYVTNVGSDNRAWTQANGWITGDTTAPSVDSVLPTGTISTDSAVVGVYYSDSQTGVEPSSVSVTLDGSNLSGCTVSASSAACTVYSLNDGAHTIGGSVSDVAGNAAAISGGFSVSSPSPPSSGVNAVPHGGYGTSNAPAAAQTDLCLSCHDIHQAEGDYALMREATVTETCGTCHGLFGASMPSSLTWTETPFDLDADGDSAEAQVSPTTAYENTGAARVSGHRLGAAVKPDATSDQYNENAGSDYIPGSTLSLKVMDSLAYDEGDIYEGESVTAYTATNGLYCASCHTPHGSVGGVDFEAAMPDGTPGKGVHDAPIPVDNYNSSGTAVTSQAYFGDQLVIDDKTSGHPKNVKAIKLVSSNPNHLNERSLKREESANGVACAADANAVTVPGDDGLIDNNLCDKFMTVDEPATSYNNWCLSCHDKQWNGSEWEGAEMHGNPVGGNNHPPLCVSCHSSSGGNKGVKDFPHTSGNQKLLSKDHDGICLGCHSSGRLP